MYSTPGDIFHYHKIFQRRHALRGHSAEAHCLAPEDVALVRKTINALTKSLFEEIAKSFGATLTFSRATLQH